MQVGGQASERNVGASRERFSTLGGGPCTQSQYDPDRGKHSSQNGGHHGNSPHLVIIWPFLDDIEHNLDDAGQDMEYSRTAWSSG